MNRLHMHRSSQSPREGIILLVVLSSLTFFSLLVAAYLVFSNQSRQSAFVLSARNTRAPDVNGLLNESLMTLIRGTNDVNNPFFGESLLDDYYGRDGIDMEASQVTAASHGPLLLGSGIVRFPAIDPSLLPLPVTVPRRPPPYGLDDLFSGRLITFIEGPLANETFRVIRSFPGPRTGVPPNTTVQPFIVPPNPGEDTFDHLFIEIGPDLLGTSPTPLAVRSLFYQDPTNLNLPDNAFRFRLNGLPRSAAGIGFDGTNINLTVGGTAGYQQPDPTAPANPVGFGSLPVALQPNHIRLPGATNVDKSSLLPPPGVAASGSDFDEGYDAADYFNWFLAHRQTEIDGTGNLVVTVIPSFHRPSVINYILNEINWSGAVADDYRDVMVSIARATYRPIPIARNTFNAGSSPINPRFTGGSSEYALRAPLLLRDDGGNVATNARVLLDQLAKALIIGQWDVDNDSDGIADSVWVDLGLPLFTSPEGKLLRPLVAPMIEDLSARLNVNAIGNSQLAPNLAGSPTNPRAYWAGALQPFGDVANQRNVFRGIGYGPADIMLPASYSYTSTATTPGVIANAGILNNMAALLNDRYRFGDQPMPVSPNLALPGRDDADALDVLRTGWRPAIHNDVDGYGYGMSMDVYGRGGVGIGRSGHVVAADSGRAITTAAPLINETVNDPYEMDPTGRLSGDLPFTLADLEAILRNDDFDSELLPQTLKNRLRILLRDYPEYRRSLSTQSSSDDSPETVRPGDASVLTGLISLIYSIRVAQAPPPLPPPPPLTRAEIQELIAPEIRLGRKLDVNRPFGNGVDDNTNRIIDEPGEVAAEVQAFAVSPGSGQTVPATFRTAPNDPLGQMPAAIASQSPNYILDASSSSIDGRQLLARHLYVLMMVLTEGAVNFPSTRLTGWSSFAEQRLYRARRLAQWAVNVVDYRDPDSIMTRFVFDPNPFDAGGWNPGPATLFNTVWGCEAPELMFTESAAFHDVRLRDTDLDDMSGTTKSGTPMDADSDQIRIPQGSAFLELYCPRASLDPSSLAASINDSRTKQGAPRELYAENTPGDPRTMALRLDATAANALNGVPVWRIAISKRRSINTLNLAETNPSAAPTTNPYDASTSSFNAVQMRNDLPDQFSFEPQSPDELSTAVEVLEYDRFIWLSDLKDSAGASIPVDNQPAQAYDRIHELLDSNGVTDMRVHQVFVVPSLAGRPAVNSNRRLAPGQFLCLIPRTTTYFGSRVVTPVAGAPALPFLSHGPSSQRIDLAGGNVNQHDHANTSITPTFGPSTSTTAEFIEPLTFVVAAPRPTSLTTPPTPPSTTSPAWMSAANVFEDDVVGFSVTEPLANRDYYDEPRYRINNNYDLDGSGSVDYPLEDAYVDYTTGVKTAANEPLDKTKRVTLPPPTGPVTRIPFDGDEPVFGTIREYCSAFLQRLADPTIPYNAVTNPYRTVDWIPIDVTVFSGESSEADISTPGLYTRRSRQRNGANTSTPNAPVNNLFSYATDFVLPGLTIQSNSTNDYFSFSAAVVADSHIQSSFGFLNTAYAPINNSIATPFNGFAPSIGTDPTASSIQGFDRNLPQTPYALHPWLNRPFVSHFELLMVPACSQGRLFEEFSIISGAGDPPIYPVPPTGPQTDPVVFHSPFRHLLNFFHSSFDPSEGAQFVRLFDFVHTLPRFRGEVEMVDPRSLTSTDVNQEAELSLLRTLLRPPFNFRYDNQRQGTVNLNSLAEFPVWAGLMQGHLNLEEFNNPAGSGAATQLAFEQFVVNRRGYPVTPGAPSGVTTGTAGDYNYVPGKLNPRFPTQFAGVFKGGTETPFAPVLRDPADTDMLRRRGVNGTLLRGADTLNQNDPPSGPPSTSSLFVRRSTEAPLTQHQDRQRNPLMRYQTLMRMPNLVSDNSQKFVIRLTMGFFEVEASDINSVGEEYNASIGQNERYRAMFIVDRAKPVGFVAGENTNSREIVIYESYEQ